MLKKSLVAPIALAFGLALSGAAAAQTAVGTITVSDEDLPLVVQHCEALHQANEDAGIGSLPDYEVDTTLELQAGVNLDSIQLSDCEQAGLIDGDAAPTSGDPLLDDTMEWDEPAE